MPYSPIPAVVALFGVALAVVGLILSTDDGLGFYLVVAGLVVAILGGFGHWQAVRSAEFNRQLKLYEDGVIDEPPTR